MPVEAVAVIGGSGLEDNPAFAGFEGRTVRTSYGTTFVKKGDLSGRTVWFLPRHGAKHALAPHQINYRANISALKKLGAAWIISTSAVGAIDGAMEPGEMVILDDFIDFTTARPQTIFDKGQVVHVDMTCPYDVKLNRILAKAVKKCTGRQPRQVVYVATEGPRFETRAEIRMFKMLGAAVVGMTNVPEVVLARELDVPYASLAVITNYACGIIGAPNTPTDYMEVMKAAEPRVTKVLLDAIRQL